MLRESQVMLELLLVKDVFGINELHAKYTPHSVKRNATKRRPEVWPDGAAAARNR